MKPLKSKYFNRKISNQQGNFDSQKEYFCWLKLKRQEEMGQIRDLQRQVPFLLIPTQYEIINIGGKDKKIIAERECKYIADFTYVDNATNKLVVVDTKSKATRTAVYLIKKKLLLFVHGIKIIEK